ncbi:MAG: ATP-dependent DNA helicase RecG [Firmicutes bacterium ADurb.Bin193]|nr:MAG: ATP-dependent DNA helicase RecG [Firmicutes bacterium ADurb.Bin193]
MLLREIGSIKGVGKTREKLFLRLGIRTAEDMLRYFPRTYEDRSQIKSICDTIDGESVCIRATACTVLKTKRVRHGLSYQKVTVSDGTGVVFITWFNHDWLVRTFDLEAEYTYYGKVTVKNGRLEMNNPVIVRDNKIEPIYPLTAGLTQSVFRSVMEQCIPYVSEIPEILPAWVREKYTLCGIEYAISNMHFPENFEKFEYARKRLAFEELFLLQLGLRLLKQRRAGLFGTPLCNTESVKPFIESLPFPLTAAQKRVIKEILSDLRQEKVMQRLVQGDVGSGKTIVAAVAMLVAAKSGAQAAMMVPTEILAEQHFDSVSALLDKFGVTVGLLTGSLTAKQKKEMYQKIASGEISVVIGTHALIQSGVDFHSLCLVVTDEQHRFGVKQRAALALKGNSPHLLVMTATPIPRTLSLILYGDLNVSVIDELPPGRMKIDTYAVDETMRGRINEFMKKQVQSGRQVYIVCPLIDDSETTELKAATEYAENLKKNVFVGFTVGLVHGRLKPKEKDDVMRRFSRGEIDVLVSTTVIEVGVNVPNATLMVIENAERFGLSQLHQLRGRVGRGRHKSYCILFNQGGGEIARQRMEIMEKTGDGFEISQKDLELRGPGEFFGTLQHGLPELKAANLYTDMGIVAISGEAVGKILSDDPDLSNEENALIRRRIEDMFRQTGEFEFN